MHHIIAVFSGKQKVAALAPFVQRAREKYDQNLAAYIRLILRRPLARVVVRFNHLHFVLTFCLADTDQSGIFRITSPVSNNFFALPLLPKCPSIQLTPNPLSDVFSPMFERKISGKRSMLSTNESTSTSGPTSRHPLQNTPMY